MREFRSGSQILFGFLPEQTVDLKNGVWKVKEWAQPERASVDLQTLRRELQKQVTPWAGNDGGFSQDLYRGAEVKVFSLNKHAGVRVERFPPLWRCVDCARLRERAGGPCRCGSQRRPGQLPFVAYHDACGALKVPFVRRCNAHREVRIVFPGTASAAEIRFECPVCGNLVQKGFGFSRCECGRGLMTVNVHRAASVYTPRTMVMVNPPSVDRVRRLTEAGGAAQALTWVLSSLESDTIESSGGSVDAFRAQLVAQGLSQKLIDTFVRQAIDSGELKEDISAVDLPDEIRVDAEAEAVRIAMALLESRVRVRHLVKNTEAWTPLGELYRDTYPRLIRGLGLEEIELIDRFPVLTGVFGYTRGDTTPGASRLVPFHDRHSNAYVVYGEVGRTEALFFRLDPLDVAQWLTARDHQLVPASTATDARISILRGVTIPDAASAVDDSAGADLLKLVHSFSHIVMRQIAVFAGVDRNALSEFLVPAHLGFFVYAASRGDFVLGGLQAVFESELHNFLGTIRNDDYRCPLDPGCKRASGACVGCLHVGEPSCRLFNRFLDRRVLKSATGYFSQPRRT